MLQKQILLLGNKKMFLPLIGKKHFCFLDTNFALKHTFPNLATPEKKGFPSLARPLERDLYLFVSG